MSLMQFLTILRARAGLVLTIAFTLFAVVAAVTLATPKHYDAMASVLVDPMGADGGAGNGSGYSQHDNPANTQADIIASYGVALRVVKTLHLKNRPNAIRLIAASGPLHKLLGFLADLVASSRSSEHRSLTDWLATQLLAKLHVHTSHDSRVLKVVYSSPDPNFAAEVANAFVQAYLHNAAAVGAEPMKQTARLFDRRLALLQDRLQKAEQRLSQFEREKGLINTGQGLDAASGRLSALQAQLVDAESQDYEARARQTRLRAFIDNDAPESDVPPSVLNSPAVQQSLQQVMQDQSDLSALSRNLGPNHPLYRAAKEKLDRARAAYRQAMISAARGLLGSVGTAGDQVAALRAAMARQRQKVLALKNAKARAAVLQSDVDNARQAYNAAAQRLAQTDIQGEAARNASATLLDAATPPLQPASPKAKLILAVALLSGLAVGVGAALWAETVDRRVRSQADIIEVLGLPVMAMLKPSRQLARAAARLPATTVPRLTG